MKNIFLIISLVFMYGCMMYDPAPGIIKIHNYSDSAIYMYITCKDTFQLEPRLKLFEKETITSIDENGKTKDPIYSPDYRVNAFNYSEIDVWGTSQKPHLYCDNKIIYFFIIKESTMRTKSWKEIWKEQLYEKKLVFTEDQLKKMDWKFTYYPNK